MTSTATFWDRVARKYAARPIGNPDAYETALARTKSYLNAEDQVLEVGAGTGSTALLLAPLVGHITASDISGEMTQIGQEKAWDASVRNISFVQGVAGDAALGEEEYDVVLAHNLLHLIPDLSAELHRIRAHIRPGGLFISKTPCFRRARFVLGPVIGLMRLFGKAPYVGFLSIEGLEAEIRRAGFEIIETGNYPVKPPSRYIVARRIG